MSTPSGRLTDSLRRAHWGALTGELVVIVAGILLALLFDGWMQDRRDGRSEVTYLEFLERDLQQTLAELEELKAFEARRLEDALLVYRSLSDGVAQADQRAVALALSRLGTRRTTRLTNATYIDLINTGNLQLIDNRDLRDRIVQFYENAGRGLDIIDKNNVFFVDEMYNNRVLGSGAVIPRPAFEEGIQLLLTADSALRAALISGYADEPDPIWKLPSNGPEWQAIRGQVIMRARVSTLARVQVEGLIAEVETLRTAASEELARHGI